jgi:hypothetical protein
LNEAQENLWAIYGLSVKLLTVHIWLVFGKFLDLSSSSNLLEKISMIVNNCHKKWKEVVLTLILRDRGCAGDFPARKSKKNSWVPRTKKIETKKEQAEPTEQLGASPKLLIFDFDDGDWNTIRGLY